MIIRQMTNVGRPCVHSRRLAIFAFLSYPCVLSGQPGALFVVLTSEVLRLCSVPKIGPMATPTSQFQAALRVIQSVAPV
jgi:hypothetical protein